jgi:hypothetical protein
LGGSNAIATDFDLQVGNGARGDKGDTFDVIDDLSLDVLVGAEDDETRYPQCP